MSVPEAPPACQPQPETCNGVDDDCDGTVDEDLPAIPCPNGGGRYCVAGRYSDCPRRCDVCVPGSKRACLTSYLHVLGHPDLRVRRALVRPLQGVAAAARVRGVANKMKRRRSSSSAAWTTASAASTSSTWIRTAIARRCWGAATPSCAIREDARRGRAACGRGRRRARAPGARGAVRRARPPRHGAARRRGGRAAQRDAVARTTGVGRLPGRGGRAGAPRRRASEVLDHASTPRRACFDLRAVRPAAAGGDYEVRWPALRGLNVAAPGPGGGGAVHGRCTPTRSGAHVRGRSWASSWDLEREQNDCTDSIEERFVFDS